MVSDVAAQAVPQTKRNNISTVVSSPTERAAVSHSSDQADQVSVIILFKTKLYN